jgi:hypothetical protein
VAGAAEGEAAIVLSPYSIDDVDHVRRVCYSHDESIVMRLFTFLVAKNLQRNFDLFHSEPHW